MSAMVESVTLTAAQQRFVENVGLHFEGLGIPRIGGRMFGLLLIIERPLALEEIAEMLSVSRASISTNSRFFLHVGLIELRALRGDRRHYYAFSPTAWEHRFRILIGAATELRKLSTEGLDAVDPASREAVGRLETAGDFGAFLEDEALGLLTRWRARQAP